MKTKTKAPAAPGSINGKIHLPICTHRRITERAAEEGVPPFELIAAAVNRYLSKVKPNFAEWLQSIPDLSQAEEITISIPVTLSTSQWFDIAHVAAIHGHTLVKAVNRMVYDGTLHDDFMNNNEYLHEVEAAATREWKEAQRALQPANEGAA